MPQQLHHHFSGVCNRGTRTTDFGKAVLPRLYERYDQLVYFVLPIAEMDYYDLNPTPPVFKHFDLISGEVSNGFVGERFSK